VILQFRNIAFDVLQVNAEVIFKFENPLYNFLCRLVVSIKLVDFLLKKLELRNLFKGVSRLEFEEVWIRIRAGLYPCYDLDLGGALQGRIFDQTFKVDKDGVKF
jgi:hypothetical protein